MAVLEALIAGLTFGSMLGWPRLKRRAYERQRREFLALLDDDCQIALDVARHEAQTRDQPLLPAHLLYGLLQLAPFAEAIGKLGGDGAADASETRVHGALDRGAPAEAARAALEVLGMAAGLAQHAARRAGIADLWRALMRSDAAALVAPAADPVALLFLLAHGHGEPATTLAHAPAVNVIVHNDDYSAMELVVEILRDVFDRPAEDALAITRQAHEHGRAVVGRFASDAARTKIEAARSRARAAQAPLWLGVEPA